MQTDRMPERPLPESVRRQLAVHKLTKFYKMFAPDKVGNVPSLYEKHKNDLPALLSELLRRYPLCPKTFFDDVRPTLAVQSQAQAAGGQMHLDASQSSPRSMADSSQSAIWPSPMRGADSTSLLSTSPFHANSPFVVGVAPTSIDHQRHYAYDELALPRTVADPSTTLAASAALIARGEELLGAATKPSTLAVASANDAVKKALSRLESKGDVVEQATLSDAFSDRMSNADKPLLSNSSFDEQPSGLSRLDLPVAEEPEDFDADDAAAMREANELEMMIRDNQRMVREVALTEQQVLQRRFELLFLKLVEAPQREGLSSHHSKPSMSPQAPALKSRLLLEASSPSPSPSCYVIVVHDVNRSGRVFSVQATKALLEYFLESAVASPHSPVKADMCEVVLARGRVDTSGLESCTSLGGSGLGDVEQHQAQRTVVAMAMRVWSRMAPFTVTEMTGGPDARTMTGSAAQSSEAAGRGVIGFHSSSTLWWQWPELCTTLTGATPAPMLTLLTPGSWLGSATFLPALVAKTESAAPGQGGGRVPLHPTVAKMFADAPSVPTIDAGRLGYMASQKDSAETETFWSHFLLRYEALAQTIAKGKS